MLTSPHAPRQTGKTTALSALAHRLTAAAKTRAFELTQGQPWLVNALARQIVESLVTDRSQPVTEDAIETAKEILIQRCDNPLGLAARSPSGAAGAADCIVAV